ncbi:MAG: bifunctional UDP-3-O-[3-hydroxymyristoyl] N-acetylglucosamine deacetylase/3-hydroxyacyl-ACP dehydratase [Bacteroidetes bacterium]|nr:MAG: bifunctional UDP-3-O-[3-hydroxymyristoyl] N-acetylglucosamine deacetylase/3-hydroxyacyl-ACP dehydratase [Bacteroidota bacterium]
MKQTTLKGTVNLSGVGLHTGALVNMVLKPAAENHGYKFQRVDIEGAPIVDADVDNVVDTSRGTTIEQNGARVYTVEHILAALAGLEIDNVLIELDGPEIPIMDGSAEIFVNEILKVGSIEQDAEREYFVVPSNIHYEEDDKGLEMIAMPLDDYRLTVMVDYNSPVLGSQHASVMSLKDFQQEIAPSRTFCFLHELEMLLSQNLIKGGDLSNAIVIVDRHVEDNELEHLAQLFNKPKVEVRKEGILNNVDLRYQNEPARHKLLDLIGDLALIGMPIRAQIMAARPGHAANVAFAKKIKALIKKKRAKADIPHYDPSKKPVYEHSEISKLLPHKFPFLLVDKVIELTANHVVAVKNITGDQYFFQGHFPENPIMPGVLQIEALAQAGGVLVLSKVPDPENYSTYFMKIDNAKFKEKVVPGDTLILRMELIAPIRRGVCIMKGSAYVGEKLVTEAEMVAQVIRDKAPAEPQESVAATAN